MQKLKTKTPLDGGKIPSAVKHLALGVTLFAITAPASAALITFTNQADWEAAVSTLTTTTETFDGANSSFAANSTGNTIGSGLTLDLLGGVGDTGPTGLTGNGQLEFEVDSSPLVTSDGLDIRINGPDIFGLALLGLTDDNTFSPAVNLHEIGIRIAGSSLLISDILGLTSGTQTSAADAVAPFIGFVSDTAFNSFTFVHGDDIRSVSGSNESFWLDGLTYAQGQTQSVPEPSTLALFGMAMVGLGFARRRAYS